MQRRLILTLAFIATVSTGCSLSSGDKTETERQLDSAYRGGYGWGNPNSERIKNHQPPLDFSKSKEGREF